MHYAFEIVIGGDFLLSFSLCFHQILFSFNVIPDLGGVYVTVLASIFCYFH